MHVDTRVPTVSVIMPSHNDAPYLTLALASVVAQTYRDWEAWVIDDGSHAEMADALKRLVANYQCKGYAVRLIRHDSPQGAARARNAGIAAAKGRYIAFLDADDRWLPEKLSRQVPFMQRHQRAFSFTAYRQVSQASSGQAEVELGQVRAPKALGHADLLRGCVVGCLTVMYDTHHFGKRYMPPLPCSQDYALWLSLLRNRAPAHGLDEILAVYTVREGSLSSNKWRKVKYHWKICRCYEGLSRTASFISLLQCSAHALTKRYRK
ncbi:glycosyltransferase [Halomonas alkaliantarctica]|nr:glycosyltransferase [Halomonas alkaliantarctica]